MNPPLAPGSFIELGIMAVASPPIVDSAHPEKDAATSPNDVLPGVDGLLELGRGLASEGLLPDETVDLAKGRAQIGQ